MRKENDRIKNCYESINDDMSKKVLLLAGSPRIGGNFDLLCDAFILCALESGNIVEKINVASKNIAPCSTCYYCKKS